MKKKINILINEEARFLGLYYGYWNWFFLFEKDLKELDLEVNFYSGINKKFLEADYLFLNSRSLPKNNDFIDIAYLKKLYSKNSNLYWFDMRDSAGTTQFEVLPYVKKYIKKQFYKDKTLYSKKIEGGRFYSDYYIKNYNIRDTQDYNSELINPIYLNKLILGWNLGVSFFFDSIKFSKMEYYKEFLKKKFFYNKNYSMILDDFETWDDDGKKFDFIYLHGIIQHVDHVDKAVKNLILSMKLNGKMWFYFYRPGSLNVFLGSLQRKLLKNIKIRKFQNFLQKRFERNFIDGIMDDCYVPNRQLFYPDHYNKNFKKNFVINFGNTFLKNYSHKVDFLNYHESVVFFLKKKF